MLGTYCCRSSDDVWARHSAVKLLRGVLLEARASDQPVSVSMHTVSIKAAADRENLATAKPQTQHKLNSEANQLWPCPQLPVTTTVEKLIISQLCSTICQVDLSNTDHILDCCVAALSCPIVCA